MGRGVLTMQRDTLRRLLVFAVLFGAAIGALVWLAGGFRGAERTLEDADQPPPEDPGDLARIAEGFSIGASTEGTLSNDTVRVVGGKPRRFRAWTTSWRRSAPKKSADPEVGIQEVEDPRVVLFPEPAGPDAGPVEDGAPGTTRVTAKRGVLEYQRGVRTTARLSGDALLERFDPERGGMRIASPALDLVFETKDGAERRIARTAERVTIDGSGAHVEGEGLESDLTGDDCRITVLRDVKGRFDAAEGSLTGTGGAPGAKGEPTDVSCAGACEIVALDPRSRGPSRRWKAVFHDDVRVLQGDDLLTCDLLEVEFRMAGDKGGVAPVPADRIVASGHVRAKGRTETREFEVLCERATRSVQGSVGNEVDTVLFEGAPVMNLFGPLGAGKRAETGAPAPRGRLEIRCRGTATMETRRAGRQANAPVRTNVLFQEDVVARHWDDELSETPPAELRAPRARLLGERLADGKLRPETLTAEGGVDLTRAEFVSRSETATWTRLAEAAVDRYLLTGKPRVTWSGAAPLQPFGRPKDARDTRLVLESADGIRVDVDARRDAAAKPRPYAQLSASPRAVAAQYVEGEEVTRCTADQIDATLGADRRLEQVRASGGAHLWGRGEDGEQRDVYATRIRLDQLVPPPGSPPDAPRSAMLTAVGEENTPAVATVREKDGTRNDVRASLLRYDEDGALVTATGDVVATVSGADAEPPEKGAPALPAGGVRIAASEARVRLAPGESEGSPRRVLGVAASGGVRIDAGENQVHGREATYDAVAGIAEVKGAPARLVSTRESERYTSFVNADLLRAYFDVSPGAGERNRFLRASAPQGGIIVRYIDPPGPDGKPLAGQTPRRLQVASSGPIEVTNAEGTAVGDVRADLWSLAPSGQWTIAVATLYCERAHLTFDPDAEGAARERLRTLTATGNPERQVLVQSARYRAFADRIVLDAASHTMHLQTTSEKSIYVRDLERGTQLLYDGVKFDYETQEWREGERVRAMEGAAPDEPGGR